jgi:hypothetical protein
MPNPCDSIYVDDEIFIITTVTPEGVWAYPIANPTDLFFFKMNGQRIFSTNLPEEMLHEIALNLTPSSIFRICETNQAICENKYFWMRKYINEYSSLPDDWEGTIKELFFTSYSLYAMEGLNISQILNLKAQVISVGSYYSFAIDF